MSKRILRKLKSHREPPELDITAFMNLMVVLVPFLLITAVFSRITILQLNLPAGVGADQANEKKITVEVIVRKDLIEIGDGAQIIMRIPKKQPAATEASEIAEGGEAEDKVYDIAALSRVLQEIKRNYPVKLDATVLMEPDLEYSVLVNIMDAVTTAEVPDETGTVQKYELFPQISVGDAP